MSARVDAAGLELDRHWMVVDAAGCFVSQRTHPRMALLRTTLADRTLHLDLGGTTRLDLSADAAAGASSTVQVWFEERRAVDAGQAAAEWMSDALGEPCRVVRAVPPPDGQRLSPDGFVRDGFADALPALVISTASLDDLNRRLAANGAGPLGMDRFRPNLVVGGFGPYEEDAWTDARVGELRAHGVRPCPRCATTMVNQERGVAEGPEPLRTLASYRKIDRGGALFGMMIAFDTPGVVRVGDALRAPPES